MSININFIFLFAFVFISRNSFCSESYIFPISTMIEKSNLYDYSIGVTLSKDFIVLRYDGENEIFETGSFVSYISTTIPVSSGESFQYSYIVSDFNSSCEESTNTGGESIINDFVDLYIDGVHYPDLENIPSFDFLDQITNDYKKSENKFSLITNQKIPNDKPLFCNGNITFNVELQL
ncbi:conserved hypothetical protein [Vibrio chagasii]|nr:conserved hypothetical protein [Vibrio chagasii]CAH6811640.1 conserved hypothetical protein [Vibrio chagasii]CAH6844706.1 conserved hypothetical protein [Vibrio chagasii]CAH6981567.1 conserved hypothetical protein [Vibrio chagasii]CAH7024750.1 conserved hypothetical protein [Vibrio chagasii]